LPQPAARDRLFASRSIPAFTRVRLYVLNVIFPLIESEIARFCAGKKALTVVEEAAPDYIEQARSEA
jgi:TPP-dependent indolepyruvate ferredoxin oxidoreductase alpha subunit